LRAHPFPGNVRELRNVIERALVRCRGSVIGAAQLGLGTTPGLTLAAIPTLTATATATAKPTSTSTPTATFASGHLPLDLSALERLAIVEALRRVRGNRTHAARLLGIGLRTLRNKLRAYREAGVEVEPAEPAGRPTLPLPAALPAPKAEVWRGALRARVSQEDRS